MSKILPTDTQLELSKIDIEKAREEQYQKEDANPIAHEQEIENQKLMNEALSGAVSSWLKKAKDQEPISYNVQDLGLSSLDIAEAKGELTNADVQTTVAEAREKTAFQNIKKIEPVLQQAIAGRASEQQIIDLQKALIQNRNVSDPHSNWDTIVHSDPRFTKTPTTLILVPNDDPRALTFPGLAGRVRRLGTIVSTGGGKNRTERKITFETLPFNPQGD